MKKNIKIARKLIRVASMLIEANVLDDCIKTIDGTTRNDKEELKNYFSDNFNVSNSNDIKKMKCFTHWIKNDKTFVPDEKADNAFDVINKKHLDYNKYKTVDSVFSDENNSRIVNKLTFNPDSEPTFKDKYNAGNGVVIYTVDDTREGQKAVRKAVDVAFGYNMGIWCLVTRKDNWLKHNADEIATMTEEQKEKLGLYSDDCLETAWNYWKNYSAYPKRAAFKNGKIFAFCASMSQGIEWWDKDNKKSYNDLSEIIPGAVDDQDFIAKNVDNLKILQDINCPVETLRKFAEDESTNSYVIKVIVKNQNCPEDVLKKLAENADSDMLKDILNNRNCSKDVLIIIANNEKADTNVLKAIVSNSKCPEDLMIKLAEDESTNKYVLNEILHNKKCPKDVLRKFADNKNTDNEMLETIMRHPNCPEDILRKMAEDENTDKQVLNEILKNENCPEDILRKIADNKNTNKRVFGLIVSNPNCPEDLLRTIAEKGYNGIFYFIARNKNCPEDVLKKFAEKDDVDVLNAIVCNQNCSEDVLRKLSENENVDKYVLNAIAHNQNCPVDLLVKIADNEQSDNDVFYWIARNKNCSEEVMRKIAEKADNDVLNEILYNPNCPEDLLIKLAENKDDYIRETAKDVLRNRGINASKINAARRLLKVARMMLE